MVTLTHPAGSGPADNSGYAALEVALRRPPHRLATAGPACLAGLALVLAGAGCGAPAGAGGADGWSGARQVPSLVIVDLGRTVACVRPGTCTIAYLRGTRAFAVSEAHDRWGTPARIPGLTSSTTLSCADPGDCVAAGGRGQSTGIPSQLSQPDTALVAIEVHGVWGPARPIPGLAGLPGGGQSGISAVACGGSGWCSVTGTYWPRGRPAGPAAGSTSFVASEHDGAWRPARPLAGPAGRPAGPVGMACGPSGYCVAAGDYRETATGGTGVFFISGDDGARGRARPMAGLATLADARSPQVSTIHALSCSAPGDCTAAGTYYTSRNGERPFAVTETQGQWGPPRNLPGTVSLQRLGRTRDGADFDAAVVTGLSCSRPGQCLLAGLYGSTKDAGGEYGGEYSVTAPFVASQVDGRWHAATQLPGLAALNRYGQAYVTSLSCGRPGNCAAGGYTTGLGPQYSQHAFVVTQTRGVWSPAGRVPGIAGLGAVASSIDVISCQATADCGAIGDYHRGREAQTENDLFATVHRA